MSCITLDGLPEDTITSLSYRGSLLASSWDQCLYLYSGTGHELGRKVKLGAPILRAVYGERITAGDTRGRVVVLDQELNEMCRVETDVGGIQLLHEYRGSVLVGGWNSKVSLITDRIERSMATRHKVHCSDIRDDVLLVGQQNCAIAYDLRGDSVLFERKYSMPVRSVALAEDGFYVGTIGGKIYYESLSDTNRAYVFNAHCSVTGNDKMFYPVNCLSYGGGSLFSGGSDGRVLRWRLSGKKTSKILATWSTATSAICRYEGRLAVGFSDSFEKGKIVDGRRRISILDA
jgi:cell cycle arrest protein BUB3